MLKIDVESQEVAALQGLEDLTGAFEEFAAMIEIAHLDAADLKWLLRRFHIELLEKESRTLIQIRATTAEELQKLLDDAKFYRQDAVLRRRRVRRYGTPLKKAGMACAQIAGTLRDWLIRQRGREKAAER